MRRARWWVWMAFASTVVVPPMARASVTATAWSYDVGNTQTHALQASAAAQRQGAGMPGSGEETAAAHIGALLGISRMTGCQINAPFQQPCNDARTQSSFTDTIRIVANAPNGTAVQLRGLLTLVGTIDGIGGYSYNASASLHTGGVGFLGSTGGTVQTVNDLSLDSTRTFVVTVHVGTNYILSSLLETQAHNRICAGGSGTCEASVTTWHMDVSVASNVRLEVLTPDLDVEIQSRAGRDYLAPAVTVADRAARATLSPAWPAPSRGGVNLTLDLVAASVVDVGVFDLAGRRVATLSAGERRAGSHRLRWDGRDLEGRALAGVFFVRAIGPGVSIARRAVLIR